MHKNAQKVEWKTQTKISCHYTGYSMVKIARNDDAEVLVLLYVVNNKCRLELAYFAGIISKNKLVCWNAFALAYYGSCRLLVMGSWQAQYKVNHCSKKKIKEKRTGEKKIPKIEKPKNVGHFLVRKSQNFDFCACASQNVVKRDAGG